MTASDAHSRILDIRDTLKVYKRLRNDPKKVMYKCPVLDKLIKKSEEELERLEECLANGEMEDSHDLYIW